MYSMYASLVEEAMKSFFYANMYHIYALHRYNIRPLTLLYLACYIRKAERRRVINLTP